MASFTLPPLDEEGRRAAVRDQERAEFLKLQGRLAPAPARPQWSAAQTTAAAGFPVGCAFLVLVLFVVLAPSVSEAVGVLIELIPASANLTVDLNITLNGSS